MDMKKGLVRPYAFLLVQLNRVADIAWIFIGLYVVLQSDAGWGSDVTWLALIATSLFAFSAESRKLYRSWRVAPLQEELSIIWRSWFVAALVTISTLYFFDNQFQVDKVTVLLWVAIVPVLLSATRVIVRLTLRATRRAGRNFRVAAILGANDMGSRVADRLIFNRWMGIRVIGFFDQRSPSRSRTPFDGPVPLVGNMDDLLRQAEQGEIDIVYITLPMRAEIRVKQLIEQLADTMVQVYYVADFVLFDFLQAQWGTLGDIPVLMVINSPVLGFNSFIKRFQDICFASILLVLAGLPMLIIAVAIKISSPGPVIYRQVRHGLDGQEFMIYKFRTMAIEECRARYKQATRDDPRVTPLGCFLRRTSLDELPQLINVLQGRMSLVGPRPHPLQLNEQHRNLITHFVLRHKVRPGITGWAQVNGYRGETETLEKMRRRLEYDLEYINNWSIWFDLRILFLTLIRAWQDRNAY
jgi:putative colanic acid biosynthesis UDP-glucose lipid carrier transferase